MHRPSPGSVRAFWRWFAEHADTLREPLPEPALYDQLFARLRYVHPDLVCEVGIADDSTGELLLSAGGIKAAFGTVRALAEAAPSLPGWRVVAFKPRRGAEATVELPGNRRVRSADVWFRLRPHAPGTVALDLYVSGGLDPEDEGMVAALFVLLDAALGEVDVATRIGPITWDRASASPALEGLHPFRDLPERFDAMVPSKRESG
ncbi:MAG TPA: hypothetical protein VK002_09800 [Rubricoccaceae bacterium]|jgi:hypothetical protein|nr:hypothetical protein [Rubricoccaceae bacterium]